MEWVDTLQQGHHGRFLLLGVSVPCKWARWAKTAVKSSEILSEFGNEYFGSRRCGQETPPTDAKLTWVRVPSISQGCLIVIDGTFAQTELESDAFFFSQISVDEERTERFRSEGFGHFTHYQRLTV